MSQRYSSIDKLIQIVVRRKPRLTVYYRRPPSHIVYPSEYLAKSRTTFGELVREAKELTVEEVANIVGGRVYDKKRKLVEMPDGRILPKVSAYVSYMMRGRRFGRTRPENPHVILLQPKPSQVIHSKPYASLHLLLELTA